MLCFLFVFIFNTRLISGCRVREGGGGFFQAFEGAVVGERGFWGDEPGNTEKVENNTERNQVGGSRSVTKDVTERKKSRRSDFVLELFIERQLGDLFHEGFALVLGKRGVVSGFFVFFIELCEDLKNDLG